ncbi:MAG: ABC-type transporter, integral rane subunit [Ilumatobacteraceae bacterium]|nr:ABC-type transporter, integral rane subunit [Ilumatobacteraceae bacterium]
MVTIELALAGLGIGSIAALSGLGLLATYRLTGVFNLAFGAIAMLVAFTMWQQVRVWHWSPLVAAAVDILVICPLVGVLLDRIVFRPLQRRRATPGVRLVASLGLLVVLLGVATVIWGAEARLDAPSIVPRREVHLGGAHLALGTIADLAAIAILGAGFALGQRSRFGLRVRAVVERRELAELRGVDADRVSAFGWAIGTSIAGLAGVLMAPTLRLVPYGFTLVMLETMAVVVIGRLTDPVRAIVSGLLIGILQAELAQVHLVGRPQSWIQAANANLFVVALLVAVLVISRLREPLDAGGVARLTTRGELPPIRAWWALPTIALGAPLLFGASDKHLALAVPAIAIVLVSIVVVSGYSGQISLGQAGFAGLGALVAARLADGTLPFVPKVPDVLALVITPIVVAPFGALSGWPAIRRRGLFLALTTFALSVAMSRFVFEQAAVTRGLEVHPPSTFASDDNFYILEVLCLGVALVLVRRLHHGGLGRTLTAMRDDELGAQSSGVDIRTMKIFVFGASSALAALGGALLAMGARSFDSNAFDPIQGLIWFAAVVVFGVDSATGAVIAAGVLVALDSELPAGSSTIAVGLCAMVLGRLPGGVLYSARLLFERLFGAFVTSGPVAAHRETTAIRLTPAGRRVAARRAAATAPGGGP